MLHRLGRLLERSPGTELLEEGAPLPQLTAADQDGVEMDLAEELGRGWWLIYFFPRADTPGCTIQACSLRDAFEDLRKFGVGVVGVSVDSADRSKRFQQRHSLPFRFLPDPEHRILKAFGVATVFGWSRRISFLFHDGTLVWRDLHASPFRQAADVLRRVGGEDPAQSGTPGHP
ncbi:MAG TPA: peroxiredoxin [Verrucomicrobiales bacterium]|nr:peroxiredoxin [Verrucomicrobiales bacterium]